MWVAPAYERGVFKLLESNFILLVPHPGTTGRLDRERFYSLCGAVS